METAEKCHCGKAATTTEGSVPLCADCVDLFCFGCHTVAENCSECGGEGSSCACGCEWCASDDDDEYDHD